MEPQNQATPKLLSLNQQETIGSLDQKKQECRRQEQPNIQTKNNPLLDNSPTSRKTEEQTSFKTISYLLGTFAQIPSYLMGTQPQKQKSQTQSQDNDQIQNEDPSILQLGSLQASDTMNEQIGRKRNNSASKETPSDSKQVSRPRVNSLNITTPKDQKESLNTSSESFETIFSNKDSQKRVGINDSSTIESGSSTSQPQQKSKLIDQNSHQAQEIKVLANILSSDVMGSSQSKKNENSIVVESYLSGLGGQMDVVDSIPCVSSVDQTQFIVFLNKLDMKSFQKSTLFNLVESAESVSPACQNIVFIVARGTDSDAKSNNYKAYKDMFEVIGAKRMLKKSIKTITKSENAKEFGQILEDFGFYKMEI